MCNTGKGIQPITKSVSNCACQVYHRQPQQQQGCSTLCWSVKHTMLHFSNNITTCDTDEWLQKIVRHNPGTTWVQLKPNPKKSTSPEVQQQTEGVGMPLLSVLSVRGILTPGERVLAAISPQEYVVVLDERGKDLTSDGLADMLAMVGEEHAAGVVFAVGGAYGHSDAVRQRADRVVKLSSCVLNHAVAQVVLLEQVYRAYTILRGEPYHH